MSVCSIQTGSDISDFANWEEQHPSQLKDLESVETPRSGSEEIEIEGEGDMGSQDTGAATRSSARIGGSQKDAIMPKPSSQGMGSRKDTSSQRPSSQRSAKDMALPKPSSQRSLKQSSQEPVRRSQRIIPSSTQTSLASSSEKRESQSQSSQKSVKGQSQDLQGRDLGPQMNAPPSSQPRDESEDLDEMETVDEVDEVQVPETQDKEEVIVGAVEEVESAQSEAEVDAADSGSVDLDLVEVEQEEEAADSEPEQVAEVDAVQVEEEAESTDSVGEVNAEIEEAASPNEDQDEEMEAEADISRDQEDATDVDEPEPATDDAQVELKAPTSSLLQQAKDDGKYTGDRRLSTFENEDDFMEYLQISVQDFAREHPFWSQTKWEDDEMDQFEDDVEQFALAAGMEDHQAEKEVKRAVQAWKLKQGMEFTDATLKTALKAAAKIANVVQNALLPEGPSKKRKRESKPVDAAPPTIEEVSAKRIKKAAKKARRKAKKQGHGNMETNLATKSQSGTSSQKLNLKTSEDWYAGDATVISTVDAPKTVEDPELVSGPSATKELKASSKAAVPTPAAKDTPTNPRSKRRRKNKQGPVASAYFPVAFAAAPVEAEPVLPVEEPFDEPVDLTKLGVVVNSQASSKIADIAKAARDAVEKAMKTTDNQQKLKRKKKRNHNKLVEEDAEGVQSEANGKPAQPPATAPPAEVKNAEPSKKRQRKRNQNRKSLNAEPEATANRDVENPATEAAVTVSTADNNVAVGQSEETNGNPRKNRGRKSKPHQEADATLQKPSVEKSESSKAPEAKLEELPSGKKPEDAEMADAPEDAPKTKRSRPARKSKADYEKEQANAVAPQAKLLETITKVSEVPTATGEIPLTVPEVEAKPIAPESAKKNRRQKSQASKEDAQIVDKIEPLTELTQTNSKKNKKDRKRKSTGAMDIDSPQQEEAKANHS